MKQSVEALNLVSLPERYIRYVQNKRKAKMFGQEMQGCLQYGVSEDVVATSDGEIHLVDQDHDDRTGSISPRTGIINTQSLLEDMCFLKNQLQCQLIRQKANGPIAPPRAPQKHTQSGRKLPSSSQNYGAGPPPLSHQQYSNIAPPVDSLSQRVSIGQMKQQCRRIEEEIEKVQDKIDRKKRKGRTTLTHEEKVA